MTDFIFSHKKSWMTIWTKSVCLWQEKSLDFWQGVLVLVEGGDSKKEPAVTYRPDIVVFHNDGTYEIREDKGKKTPAYKIKETIIHQKFPNIAFKEV